MKLGYEYNYEYLFVILFYVCKINIKSNNTICLLFCDWQRGIIYESQDRVIQIIKNCVIFVINLISEKHNI